MAVQVLRPAHVRQILSKGGVLPAALVVAWASGYVAGPLALRDAPPLAMLAIRFGLAALVLLGVALLTRAPWPHHRRTIAHIIAAGLLTQGAQFGFAYEGVYQGVSPAVAALIIGLMPMLVAAFSGPILGERLRGTQWAGLLLGFSGVALVVAQRLSGGNAFEGRAIALVILALLGSTAGMLYQKRFVAGMDLRTGGFLQAAPAGAVLGLLALTVEHGRVELVPAFALSIAWIVIVNSLGALTVMFVMIRNGTANRAASTFYLIPPVAAVMTALVLHEHFSAFALLGFAVASAGVSLASRAP